MFVLTLKWNKKTAVLIIAAVALLLVILVLAIGRGGSDRPEDAALGIQLNTCEKRVAYLASLGWEADPASETEQNIVIPREFSQIYAKYNELQKTQGFDLSEYCGMDATVYTYTVSNHPSGETVMAQIILSNGQVIGGDIHSTALGGFMHGLKPMAD